MSPLVYVAMFGWIPVALWLFHSLPPRKALITSFLAAWLFLPIAAFDLPGLPDYTKTFATCLPALLGLALFDPKHRLRTFRIRWFDLPMVVWCLCPIAFSISNDLGVYEAFSAFFNQLLTWGLPYIFGRVYLRTPEGLRDLAKGIIIGGMIYVPLCLFEIRMSPKLHKMVYGFDQHSILEFKRFGGWRPIVFMEHGLALSLWMTIATFLALTLLRSGAVRKVGQFSLGPVAILLTVTTVLCKSLASVIWLIIGTGVYLLTRKFRIRYFFLALISFVPVYLTGRLVLDWSGQELVSWTQGVDQDRSDSLYTRLRNEEMLKKKALERPLFGWGRFGRNRIYDEEGRDISITDSMWIISLGSSGLVGMISFYLAFLLPSFIIAIRIPPRAWAKASIAPIISMAFAMVLYALDLLLNPVINPIFMLIAGGISSFPKMKFVRKGMGKAEIRECRTPVP